MEPYSMPVKESYTQAKQQVRRLLEGVGGSADAYEEPLPSSPAAPSTPEKPSWEEIQAELSKPEKDNPFEPTEDASSAGESEAFRERLGGLVSEKELLETFEDLGLDPGVKTIHEVAEGMLADWDGDDPCGGEIGVLDLDLGQNIDGDRYRLVGMAINMGELDTVFRTMVAAARSGGPRPEECFEAVLESGTYEAGHRNGCWEITDTVKGIRYLWEDVSRTFCEMVNEKDHFIWVIRVSDDEDLGYIHNGDVFLCLDND